MKTIVITNQKGGVGKSAVATQLGYDFGDRRRLRTLFIDLDTQANSTKAMTKSGLAAIAPSVASACLRDANTPVPAGNFVLIPADKLLGGLEKNGELHNSFARNFRSFLSRAAESFDACIIDTSPNTDVRMMSALVSADFVLSPTEMNQEAIDGIGALRHDLKIIEDRALNPKLRLLGLLPNKVMPTPFQKGNFAEIVKHFSKMLLPLEGGGFAHLKSRTAVAEAQAAGQPIYKSTKTSAREAWVEWQGVFDQIAKEMGVDNVA